MYFRKIAFVIGGAMMVLASSAPVFAVPILQGTPAAATGISELDIGGTIYDIQFSTEVSYNTFYGSVIPLFFGDPDGANEAALAIRDFLNISLVNNIDGFSFHTQVVNVPHDVDLSGTVFGWDTFSGDTTGTVWEGPGITQIDRNRVLNLSWTAFTRATVPEPTTLALMGLGLAGLGFSRKRKAA